MAEEHHNKPSYEYETAVGDDCKGGEEIKDRGLFDFLGKKKEEKPQEEVIVSEFEKVSVSEYEAPPKVEEYKEEKEEKEHATLFEKLHRSNSSSSSSSDEEEGEGEEKMKKKKEKKEKEDKLKEKEEEKKYEDTNVPIEMYEDAEVAHDIHAGPAQAEEKKGFLDKIKEKLPGQHKAEEVPPPPPPTEYAATEPPYEGEPKEKKGFLEKIKEKIPGYHPKTEEEKEKEKEKDIASH